MYYALTVTGMVPADQADTSSPAALLDLLRQYAPGGHYVVTMVHTTAPYSIIARTDNE